MEIGEFAMSIAEVSVYAAPPGHVSGIVGIGKGKAFQDCELRLDQVEPGSFCCCPDRPNVESW